MSSQVIDGKAIAAGISQRLQKEVAELKNQGITPGLAVILVGENPASQVYVRNKEKACEKAGIYSRVLRLPEQTSQAELLELIKQLNSDSLIHGILVQLPLPAQINEQVIMNAILPQKDADGFHPSNLGKLLSGEEAPIPCTPAGIIELIKSTGVDLKGKEAVVIGRSNIVGKPVALLLLREHATVTICHSRTHDLAEVARRADILVVAIGKAKLVKKDFVKSGAVVIDVGINREDDKLVGDVDFEEVKESAGWLTPVPGGVGPMTIAMLMENAVKAARRVKAQQVLAV